MSNLRLTFLLTVSCGLLCGFIGMVVGAIAGTGTSILLAGFGFDCHSARFFSELFADSPVYFLVLLLGMCAAVIIIRRRKNFP